MIVLLVDIEGVILDNSQRIHLWKAGEWEAYDDACLEDTPHDVTVAFLQAIMSAEDIYIVAATGRREKYLSATINQLGALGIHPDEILMRSQFDIPKTKEAELKIGWLRTYVIPKFGEDTMIIALEDRDDVVEAYRNAGIECWQIRNGAIG